MSNILARNDHGRHLLAVEEMLEQLGMYSRAVEDIAISVAEAQSDIPPHTWSLVELYAHEVRELAYALSERVQEHRGDCPSKGWPRGGSTEDRETAMIRKPYQVDLSALPRIVAESEVWINPNTGSTTHPLVVAVYVPEYLTKDLLRLFPEVSP